MRINKKKLQQLLAAGKIRGYSIPAPAKKRKKLPPAPPCKEVQWMHWNLFVWCKEHSLQLRTEFRFHPKRQWRFDFAIPEKKLAIEYEGLNSEKSGHTTLIGYTGDTEKYNAAQAAGWRMIRLTVLNYKTILTKLREYK